MSIPFNSLDIESQHNAKKSIELALQKGLLRFSTEGILIRKIFEEDLTSVAKEELSDYTVGALTIEGIVGWKDLFPDLSFLSSLSSLFISMYRIVLEKNVPEEKKTAVYELLKVKIDRSIKDPDLGMDESSIRLLKALYQKTKEEFS